MRQSSKIRSHLAKTLHEQLGQHLAGTLLTAGALSIRLSRRQAPEAREAAFLVDKLDEATRALNCFIRQLDAGKPR